MKSPFEYRVWLAGNTITRFQRVGMTCRNQSVYVRTLKQARAICHAFLPAIYLNKTDDGTFVYPSASARARAAKGETGLEAAIIFKRSQEEWESASDYPMQ